MATPESCNNASCKLCTIQLEELCYERAWWFRVIREGFAVGVRIFSFALQVNPDAYKSRSPMCKNCIRFRKNVLKCRSRLFNKLDSVLNPIFNRIRDSLLTPEEMRRARVLARCAEDKQFVRPADLATLSELF